ncbi:hypothetical protein RFI_11148 [Reticulomyxa filosa]|uniref:Initiation factor eIF2 gamma C-terminal domain-containing protein n=1 Tax=Reticulomyxa filosa TaxID=46433 RepID=X6NJ99_RETFI|nr:hypothetical protein RFI_11148 [Reticulomyxa filosa]|eukprot:ETO25988.1 hypothetical protein RFI_11148 [Reticulomyxa filosa]
MCGTSSGGVVGGVILSGVLRLGQVVEIRPGLILNDDDGNFVVYPIRSHVHHIQCGVQALPEVYPGANVGVQLNIDPFLTKGDRMVGHVMIAVNLDQNENTSERRLEEDDIDEKINQKPFEKKPPVFYKCILTYVLLEGYEKAPFSKGETLRLNVGSVKVCFLSEREKKSNFYPLFLILYVYVIVTKNGTVTKPKMKITDGKGEHKVAISVELTSPICADVGSLCAITRNIKKKWVLAAGAVIQSVQSMTLQHVGSHV